MKKTIITLAAGVTLIGSASAQLVSIASVTASPGIEFGNGAGVNNLIDGSTSAVTNSVLAGTTNASVGFPHVYTFNLGGVSNISTTNISNDFGAAGHGINAAQLQFFNGSTLVGSQNISVLNQVNSIANAQVFSTAFNGVDSVQLTVLSAHGLVPTTSLGTNNSYQIGEVSFSAATAIPEPSGALLLGLSALGFLGRRKRS